MADSLEMTVVDPDAPSDLSVSRALAALPTWEEWLQQHGFTPQERTRFTGSQWNREWRDQGRGWKVRVAPASDTINVIVYNNPLRYGRQLAMVSVGERSVPKVVQRLTTEIEREVSDATKKRRIMAYTSGVPWEDREDKFVQERPATHAALKRLGLIESVESDPDEISPDQMERALKRVRVHCFIPGQRVRVRRPQAGRLTNAMGTVVDATEHACYVAIDDFVNAGDPDPFRFTEDELEPVYEGKEPDPDAPEPYLAALDYITPLKQLGYHLISGTYRKNLPLGDKEGRLKIEVEPQKQDVAAVIYVEYASLNVGEIRRIQDILVFSPFDIVDTCREIEKLAFDDQITGVSDFADELRKKGYKGTPVTNREHLWYIFGEAIEAEDPDDPAAYFAELQRHGAVINGFREHGVRMGRRMSADRPYYRLFWVPSAVEDVSYDIYLTPEGDGTWTVSAEGSKEWQHEVHGDWQEEFDIEQTWTIPAEGDFAAIADDILAELRRHKGPEEPTITGPDVDDIDEGIDDEIDFERYAKDSANYNPVQLLRAADVRKIIKDTGYRVNSLYYSQRTTGYTLRIAPGTDEQLRDFKQSPDREASRMLEAIRKGIIARLPMLGKIERGMYNIDDKLQVHCWSWGDARYKDTPDDIRNFLLYVDIQPIDHQRRGPKGKMLPESANPDEIEDMSAYLRSTPDAVAAIKEAGYGYTNDINGKLRWQKWWPLPKPLRRGEHAWQPAWTSFWCSPDPWGQFVYGLTSDEARNSSDTGYIIVRPIKRSSGKEDTDYATSVRRVLLKVAALVKALPDTDSPDEMRKFVHTGMQQIQADVNTEADPTWRDQETPVTPVGEALDDPAGYVDRLERAQYCPRCQSHATVRTLGGDSGKTEYWKCNACGDKFLWSDERSVGFKLEAVEPDPDDPAMMVNRARAPKMGDIVNIVCPRCGDVHQSAKNWPDNAPKEWGFPCGKCGAHIPLVNVVLDSVDDDLDPQKYANDVLYVDNTLTALGYHFAWNAHFPHWQKMINPQLQFVVFVETDRFKWQFQAYRPTSDGKWALKTSSPGREFSTIRVDLEMWERKARAGELLPESEEPEVDPAAYALATFDPVQFLKDNGWAFHSQQHYTYYAKTFKLPRPYQLGGMTFTGVQVRVGIERSLFGTVSVGAYMVDDQDSGLGIQGYDLSRQQVYPWDEQEQGTAPERVYDNGMSIRRFAQGIEGVIANAKWPENRTAALLASNAVKAEIDRFIKELNKGSAVPLHAAEPVVEAFDPDDPEGALRQMPQQTYVIFTRSLEEDQEIAEGNFPGEPLEQALGKQLLRELAEANVFDMATLRVIGVSLYTDDDKYSVRVAFSGEYESDESLRDLIQSTYREAAVAGEFNIEQYRPVPTKSQQVRCLHCGRTIRQEDGVWVDPEATGDDSMWRETCDAHDTFTAEHEPDDPTRSSGPVQEALDPDDPTAMLQSHPGFQFKDTSYLGVMVFIKGPGEDKSDWPQDIGRVIRGPEPDPPYAQQRWYVIGVRGIVPEQLDAFGFGIHKHAGLRTFDTKEDAAMAIWLTWSRLDKKRQRGYLLPNT